jgi:hypothetical protein
MNSHLGDCESFLRRCHLVNHLKDDLICPNIRVDNFVFFLRLVLVASFPFLRLHLTHNVRLVTVPSHVGSILIHHGYFKYHHCDLIAQSQL